MNVPVPQGSEIETVKLPGLADLLKNTKEQAVLSGDSEAQADDSARNERADGIRAAERELDERRRQFESDLAKAKSELEEVRAGIETAKQEAAVIRQQAETEADKIRRQAKTDGYQDGIAESKEEYEKVLERERSEFGKSVQAMATAKHEILEEMEPAVLDLACHIAEKIVKESLDRNDELFMNIVRDTIKEVEDSEEIVLRLNKKEYDRFFRDGKNEYAELLKNSGVEVRQDMSVDSGECIVETEYGTLRSGVKTQLERIRSALEQSS